MVSGQLGAEALAGMCATIREAVADLVPERGGAEANVDRSCGSPDAPCHQLWTSEIGSCRFGWEEHSAEGG